MEEIEGSKHTADLESMKNLNFLGEDMEAERAKKIALAEIDPISYEEFPITEEDKKVLDRVLKKNGKGIKKSNSYVNKGNFGGQPNYFQFRRKGVANKAI